jgi:hypothetical protein
MFLVLLAMVALSLLTTYFLVVALMLGYGNAF